MLFSKHYALRQPENLLEPMQPGNVPVTYVSDSNYRFAMRANNSKTQLIRLSETYKFYEAAREAMNHFREFVTDDIGKEAETLDMVRKDAAETEHFKRYGCLDGGVVYGI